MSDWENKKKILNNFENKKEYIIQQKFLEVDSYENYSWRNLRLSLFLDKVTFIPKLSCGICLMNSATPKSHIKGEYR